MLNIFILVNVFYGETNLPTYLAKLYAYKQLDIKKPEDKRCKGIKKCVVKKTLTFDDYKKCLDDGENVCREQILFQNKDHEVYTSKANKIALNRNDDKRLVQANQISMQLELCKKYF